MTCLWELDVATGKERLVADPRAVAPSAEEVAWATGVLAAFEQSGGAATRTASGEFVDMPVAERARQILGS